MEAKKKHRVKRTNGKMRVQLSLVIVIMITVTVSAIGAINYFNDINRLVEGKKTVNLMMSKVAADQVDMYVASSIDVLETVAETVEFQDMDRLEKNFALSKITTKNVQFKSTFITDLQGNIVGTSKGNAGEGKNYANEEWFKAAVNGQTFISNTLIDEESNVPMVVLSIPLERTISGKTGVLAVELRLDRLFYLTRNIKTGDTGICYIVDSQGKIIAHPQFTEKVLTSFNALDKGIVGVQNVLGGNDGAEIYVDMDGYKVVGGYSLASNTKWGVVVEQQYSEITSQGRASLNRTFMISIFFILAGLAASLVFSNIFVKPIINMVQVANKIKDGDLTDRIVVSAKNEVGILQGTVNDMADSLTIIIKDVKSVGQNILHSMNNLAANAERTSEAVTEIAAVVDQVAAGTDKQLDSVKSTASVVQQISINAKQVTENSIMILNATNHASNIAKEGMSEIQNINETMNAIDHTVVKSSNLIKELSDHTQQIGQIVQIIKGISDQTNLLALNAAIEAARAGEHGLGFAVVADEVRKLAEQSNKASTQIVELINKIQKETGNVVKTMENSMSEVRKGTKIVSGTTASFYNIIEETHKVAREVEDFTAAMEELSAGMDLVENAIDEVSVISKSTVSGTQTILENTIQQDSAIKDIIKDISSLTDMVSQLEDSMKKFVMNSDDDNV